MKNGRALLISASDRTTGHGTTANATFYARDIAELMRTAPRLQPGGTR